MISSGIISVFKEFKTNNVEESRQKMLNLNCQQTKKQIRRLMSKILKKQVQNKISNYFIKLSNHLSKPESRCVREMVTGILKNGTVLVNQIASGINDSIAFKQDYKTI